MSEDERYELSDAINEVMSRMVVVGQTEAEIRYGSLSVLWGIAKQQTERAFGTWETPGMLGIREAVEAAIVAPRRIAAVPHIEAMHELRRAGGLALSLRRQESSAGLADLGYSPEQAAEIERIAESCSEAFTIAGTTGGSISKNA